MKKMWEEREGASRGIYVEVLISKNCAGTIDILFISCVAPQLSASAIYFFTAYGYSGKLPRRLMLHSMLWNGERSIGVWKTLMLTFKIRFPTVILQHTCVP